MADTYEAFYNGKPLNPNRGLPTMTYAQAEDCGLTESERLWCRTDGEDTPITADNIPYSTGVSVKDKIDGLVYTGSLDDLKTTGTYGHTVTASSNAPTTVNEGSLVTIQVLGSQQGLFTQILCYGNMRMYIRRFYNDSWSDWNTIYTLATKTVTNTTNANGVIALNLNGGHCISCKVTGVNSNRTAVLFTYGNDWFADIKDPTNMSNIANTSVTVEVLYLILPS